jgi:hypothetical protein
VQSLLCNRDLSNPRWGCQGCSIKQFLLMILLPRVVVTDLLSPRFPIMCLRLNSMVPNIVKLHHSYRSKPMQSAFTQCEDYCSQTWIQVLYNFSLLPNIFDKCRLPTPWATSTSYATFSDGLLECHSVISQGTLRHCLLDWQMETSTHLLLLNSSTLLSLYVLDSI